MKALNIHLSDAAFTTLASLASQEGRKPGPMAVRLLEGLLASPREIASPEAAQSPTEGV